MNYDIKNLDIVYTAKPDDKNDELKYSLRSLINIPHKNVFIVGYKPSWANTKYVRCQRISRNKIANTNFNWLQAALNKEISDPFILMNDDFFINNQITELKSMYFCNDDYFRYYYNDNFNLSSYTKTINNTSTELQKRGIKDAKCYELHTPMIVYKEDILSALKGYDFKTNPVNIRTLVGNIGNYGGLKADDVKVYGTDKEKHRSLLNYKYSDFISTDDIAFARCEVGRYIKEKFNIKSEYEL